MNIKLVILIILLTSPIAFAKVNLNRHYSGSYMAYYSGFNIPFYASDTGPKNWNFSYFFPGMGSYFGELNYTHKINETTKWGVGIGLPLIVFYVEKMFYIKNKNLYTTLLAGGPANCASVKIFAPLKQSDKNKSGFSASYYIYSGFFDNGYFPGLPGTQSISLDYEMLIKQKKNSRLALIFSIGANYLLQSYLTDKQTGSSNYCNLGRVSIADVEWERKLCWNASLGINF